LEDTVVKRLSLLALGLILVAAPARAQTADQKKQTIAYLHSLRNINGGYRPTVKDGPSELRATLACVRALHYFGGEPKRTFDTGIFIHTCFDARSGGFTNGSGAPNPVLTAVGLLVMVDLKMPREAVEKRALEYLAKHAEQFEHVRMAAAAVEAVKKRPAKSDDWLAYLKKLQNADGTFGTGRGRARDTGGAAGAVLRLGGKVDRKAVLTALDAGQRADGGFGKATIKGSDLETTYRVVRTYHMLKARPARADACRAFVAKCRNPDGGYGIAPGQPSAAGPTYFAGIVLHWLAEKGPR
jgi:hypothetical protein